MRRTTGVTWLVHSIAIACVVCALEDPSFLRGGASEGDETPNPDRDVVVAAWAGEDLSFLEPLANEGYEIVAVDSSGNYSQDSVPDFVRYWYAPQAQCNTYEGDKTLNGKFGGITKDCCNEHSRYLAYMANDFATLGATTTFIHAHNHPRGKTDHDPKDKVQAIRNAVAEVKGREDGFTNLKNSHNPFRMHVAMYAVFKAQWHRMPDELKAHLGDECPPERWCIQGRTQMTVSREHMQKIGQRFFAVSLEHWRKTAERFCRVKSLLEDWWDMVFNPDDMFTCEYNPGDHAL